MNRIIKFIDLTIEDPFLFGIAVGYGFLSGSVIDHAGWDVILSLCIAAAAAGLAAVVQSVQKRRSKDEDPLT